MFVCASLLYIRLCVCIAEFLCVCVCVCVKRIHKLCYKILQRTNDKEAIMTLVSFDTECLDEFLTYIKKEVIGVNNHVCRHVRATGVSCLKYREKISEELNVQ